MLPSELPCERRKRDVEPAEPLHHKDAVAVQSQPSLPARECVERHQQKRRFPVQHHHRNPGGNNEAVPPSEVGNGAVTKWFREEKAARATIPEHMKGTVRATFLHGGNNTE